MSVSRTSIRLVVEGVGEAEGELIRFLAPRTVEAVVRSLPLEGRAALWKGEVYFEIPVKTGKEKAKAIADGGAIAYWPMGSALCIFYERSRPYSPVNVIGRVTKNLDLFRNVKSGTKIVVERLRPQD